MKSYSQTKQDLFALMVNGHSVDGFFMDVGCSIPTWQSNARLLLERGWRGVCVDRTNHFREWQSIENAQFICADAVTIDWPTTIEAFKIPQVVDYLSMDVDSCTLEALKHWLDAGFSFRCATVEHDSYRFGIAARDAQRELLNRKGYIRVADDISSEGLAYEDWYVHPDVIGIEEMRIEITRWHKGVK